MCDKITIPCIVSSFPLPTNPRRGSSYSSPRRFMTLHCCDSPTLLMPKPNFWARTSEIHWVYPDSPTADCPLHIAFSDIIVATPHCPMSTVLHRRHVVDNDHLTTRVSTPPNDVATRQPPEGVVAAHPHRFSLLPPPPNEVTLKQKGCHHSSP